MGVDINTAASPANQDFRILLIDDNADASGSMCDLLQLFGYDVRTAANGIEGLAQATEFKPHLILSDIGLPGMDGYQLAPALRQAATGRKVILAALTGYGMSNDRSRAIAAGFDHHMVKPIGADTLLKFVADQHAAY
ncbi:MAG: response regulator [Pseudomonadota bacterium]